MHKVESSINYNRLMHLLMLLNRQLHNRMILVMDNKHKQYNLYSQLLANQSLYSNGLTQADTLSEGWMMEAQCGGTERIGRNMPDYVTLGHIRVRPGDCFGLAQERLKPLKPV